MDIIQYCPNAIMQISIQYSQLRKTFNGENSGLLQASYTVIISDLNEGTFSIRMCFFNALPPDVASDSKLTVA